MHKQMFLVATLCSAIALTVIPSNAQAGGVRSHVPFEFSVSSKTLPAGEYTMIARSYQVRIQDTQKKVVAMVLANDLLGCSPGENGQIIFHCYKARCFLSEVWTGLKGRRLLTSKMEAHLAKEERVDHFALLEEKPQKRE